MRVRIEALGANIFKISCGSDVRRPTSIEHNGETARVLRIRPGCGRGWYQVQLQAGDMYCDARIDDLQTEGPEDREAIEACTPRHLPEFVQVG